MSASISIAGSSISSLSPRKNLSRELICAVEVGAAVYESMFLLSPYEGRWTAYINIHRPTSLLSTTRTATGIFNKPIQWRYRVGRILRGSESWHSTCLDDTYSDFEFICLHIWLACLYCLCIALYTDYLL